MEKAQKRTVTRVVDGMVIVNNSMIPPKMVFRPITVRAIKDALGESISFSDDMGGVMLQIPVEKIRDLLKLNPDAFK